MGVDLSDKRGMVYIVGAGPGHPELITRRGYDLLWRCDAVVYDDLIPLELVIELPSRVERYYVGKRGGKPSARQQSINDLLIELSRRGLSVVRLKGGDPSVFGRSGEEVSTLVNAGCRLEIVPGITAASGAAASIGLPLTDRSAASWLMLATGHSAVSGSPPVPWEALGTLEGGTLVIYMGVGELESITTKLLAGEMAPDQNCMIVENACTSVQRILTGRLTDIVLKCRQEKIKPPALIIIGKTTTLAMMDKTSQDKPLSGKRVLITRPASRMRKICRLFREVGAEPLPYPTIQTTSVNDENGWSRFKSIAAGGEKWCVFTSEAGVESFFGQLPVKGLDLRCLGEYSIAAVGTGTASALNTRGFTVDLIPKKALVGALAEELKGKISRESAVVRVRGNLGDRSIEDAAGSIGAQVIPLTVYQTSSAEWESNWKTGIRENPPDYIVFSSGSTVTGFTEILGIDAAREATSRSRVVVIGPSTAAKVREYGLTAGIEAAVHNVEGIREAIIKYELDELR